MYSRRNVISYLVCRWLVDRKPSLAFNPVIKRVLEYCFQDWVNWKAQDTMVSVDKQTEEIKQQWTKEDNEKIVKRAQQMFPDSKVSLHNNTGAVLIEHPADGSKAQSLLGGPIEIRAPWTLNPGSSADGDK